MPAHDSTETRILTEAADHIRRYGLARTTVTSIAEALGMSHANVYRYYSSKAALVEAVTAVWLRPIEALLHDIADSPDPADDKLERMLSQWARAYRTKLDDDPVLFDLFAAATAEGHSVARKHRTRVQAEIARVVEDGLSVGAFVAPDQRRAMALIFDVVHRFIHPVSVGLDRTLPRNQLDPRMERTVRLTLRALAQGVVSTAADRL